MSNMLLAIALYIVCPGAVAQTSVGTVDVGAKTTIAATVTISSAGTLAGIAVSTQGVPNLDFTNAGGGTCTTGNTYALNATCTVKVTFAPQYPGARYGAIVLTNSTGVVLGSAYLQGTGLGAQISYLPVGIGDGGNAVYLGCPIAGVAIDAAGSLYFTCPTTSAAYKETPTATGYTSTQIAFGLGTPDGLYSPQGIAVDGAGNVYIADSTQNRVVKETPSAGGYTQSTVITDLSQPQGLAVDGGGNLYIANYFQQDILKETLANGSYTQSELAAKLTGPTAIAVDGSGNVFVVSPLGSTSIYMLAYANGSYTQSLLGSGFQEPIAVAVDGVGDVYIQDAGDLWKETPANGTYTQTQLYPRDTNALGYNPVFFGSAIDGSGNLWVTGSEYSMGSPNSSNSYNFGSTELGVPVGYSDTLGIMSIGNAPLTLSKVSFPSDFPEGVPAASPPDFPPNDPPVGECASGESLAIADICTLTIEFLPKASLNGQTSITLSENLTLTTNALADGGGTIPISLSGEATQPRSNVLIASSADPIAVGLPVVLTATVPGTAVIPTGKVTFSSWPYPFNPGSQPTVLGTASLNSSGQATFAVPASPVGSYIYSASYAGDANFPANSSIEITQNVVSAPGVADFGDQAIGSVNVGATGGTVPLTITFASAQMLGSISVLTQGAANLDFLNAGGGTCAAGQLYAANTTCTVNVAFTPLVSGPRYGAVVLADQSGNVIGTGYLQGTGIGPQTVFSPGAQSNLNSTAAYPTALAVDASDNVYFVNGSVYKLTPSNGSYTQSVLLQGVIAADVTVDGSGNLYVVNGGGDSALSEVYKLTPSNGGYTQTPIGYGLQQTKAVAVDGAGNVYISDFGNYSADIPPTVYRETPSKGGYVQSSIGSGWGAPVSLAVDGGGNVYVLDQAFNANPSNPDGPTSPALLKMTPSNGTYTTSLIDNNSWKNPVSVAVDGAGNVFVADPDNDQGGGFVRKETLQPDGSYVSSSVVTTLKEPFGVAIGGNGDVYLSAWDGTPSIYKLDVANPPSLSFANTNQGATSSDSPKVVTITNGGNSTLNFSALSYPADFPEAASASGACTSSTDLSSGASCNLTVDFTPDVSGSTNSSIALTENLTLASNSLNATSAQQELALMGTEIIATPPGFAVSGTSITVSPGATTGNTSTITITPSGGFIGVVNLKCAITPGAASDPPTCTIPASATVNGTSAVTVTATVGSTAPTTAFTPVKKLFWPTTCGVALAVVLLCGIPARRREWVKALGVLAILLLVLGSVAACGGGDGGNSGGGGRSNPGTTPGVYTLTISATSGGITETCTATLTVQ